MHGRLLPNPMDPLTLMEQTPLAGTKIYKQGFSQTYEEVKLLIFKAAHKWSRVYSVPYDDVLSAAHEVFVNTFYRYDPARMETKAKFSTYLHFALHVDLCSHMNKEKKNLGHSELDSETYDLEVNSFVDNSYREALEQELDEDARYIISLVLEPTPDFNALMIERKAIKKRDVVWVIREYLMHSKKWQGKRIEKALSNVRHKVNEE